jgi:hypothetical protein
MDEFGSNGMSLTANQNAFAQYLAGLWGTPEGLAEMSDWLPEGVAAGAGLLHSYRISQSSHWKPWRGRIASPNQHWWCRSLWEAFLHYSWPDDPKPNSFECIAARLRHALVVHDQAAVRLACLGIFHWGGVARSSGDKSRVWVEDQYQQKTLCQSILHAVQLLQPGSAHGLTAFDGQRLLMNAAMTKIYAAADPDNIIIYDGRVGAALGLLARYWLVQSGIAVVPGDVAFCWGAGRSSVNRNPSFGAYKFASLYRASTKAFHKDAVWANQVRLAGGVLRQMLRFNPGIGSIAAIEKALFMIGFNVDPDLPPLPLPRVTP